MKNLAIALTAFALSTGAFFALACADGPASRPAATQSNAPACCSDDCKKMGKCCTTDDKGKVTCSMGGGCCKKSDDKGMGGMDMGK